MQAHLVRPRVEQLWERSRCRDNKGRPSAVRREGVRPCRPSMGTPTRLRQVGCCSAVVLVDGYVARDCGASRAGNDLQGREGQKGVGSRCSLSPVSSPP